MKKTKLLVILTAISLLYFPAKVFYRFYRVSYILYFQKKLAELFEIFRSLYLYEIVWYLAFIAPLVIAMGLVMFKKWAYQLLMLFSFFYIIRIMYSLVLRLTHVSLLGQEKFLLIGSLVFKFCYFLVIIWYFTRPKVKELFK